MKLGKLARSTTSLLLFASGLAAGWFLAPRQTPETASAPRVIGSVPEDLRIPDLVARQLATGNLTCPDSDPLTREACLLFQGALGVWQDAGLRDTCETAPTGVPVAHPLELRPEDAARAPDVPCFGYIYAAQVAAATPILVSTAQRRFQARNDADFFEPGSDPLACLAARYGICGNHAAVGVALLRKAGMAARPVEFYYSAEGRRQSHMTPEVLIDGAWRLLDTTYGAFWADSSPGRPFELSPTDALAGVAGGTATRFENQALRPSYYGPAAGATEILAHDFFEYLSPGADVLRGGTGVVTIPIGERDGIETFAHRPNYIGDNQVESASGGLSFRLVGTRPREYELQLRVSAAAASGTSPAEICVDDRCLPYTEDERVYSFRVTSPRRIYVKSTMDVAYIVLESLEWTTTG